MVKILWDNGTGCLPEVEPEEALERWGLDAMAVFMDDDTREAVHNSIAPCSELEFLRGYLDAAPADLIIG